MASVRVFRVIVPVTSIDAAAAYYGEVLEGEGERVSPGRHYFRCGDVILACYDPMADGDGWVSPPNPDHLYLSVSDLDAIRARVGARPDGQVMDDIAVRPWGERSFYCRDPFGNKLCFVADDTLFVGSHR